ncbi:hypothetical protein PM10SUCC1_32640 [Propionigenium maris DSM 9537]|uniref:HTH cro/C1-type domain-containing protein n=1 Tax=Propionigenium maris DSM 9537 TaxID=1123000 RepID=A0A9W6GPF2_9FUSO|nr:helix-turn-helix transcriptional regulator [Propionigenium maris]GLI57750.1 hypothetical protein PM10SUCC1_32640 [Propionigenium maris DSM 9537]
MDKIRTTGEIIIEYLERNGKTQKQIAEECGKSQPFINKIVKNKTNPPEDFLSYFTEKYNVTDQDLSDIYSYEEYRKISPDWKRKIFDLMEENKKLQEQVDELKDLERFKEAFTMIALENFGKKKEK